MYDSNQADYCRITVIATGIEETPASRFGTSFARKPITPSVGQTGMKTTVSATGANTTRPYNSALQQPVHRVGNPMDIANMVLFLCSEKAGFITGENICIDGGMTKQMIYHGDCGWRFDI